MNAEKIAGLTLDLPPIFMVGMWPFDVDHIKDIYFGDETTLVELHFPEEAE